MAINNKQIILAHGGGGQLTDELISNTMLPRFSNPLLSDLLDSAVCDVEASQIAITIDGFVVQPLFFPGGDIGRLAVCGTINDLAAGGAKPLGLALGLILAEGLEKEVLDRIMDSVAETAEEAGVSIITGDTKVVGHNQADGIYITTAGIGQIDKQNMHPKNVQPGDVLIINGPVADHGLAVMLAREMPEVQSVIRSDVAPLNGLVTDVLAQSDDVVFMRDPTRGGLAGLCAELAERCGYHIVLDETNIFVRPETQHAADMLGLDPLDVANEGKMVMAVREKSADKVLDCLRQHPLGQKAKIFGQVTDTKDGICEIETTMGGRRILQKPYGEQLPRIC